MLAAASNPRNSEWQGGSISRNGGAPPNLTGSFTSVGAANTPGSQIGTPAIAFARQNRGTNIREFLPKLPKSPNTPRDSPLPDPCSQACHMHASSQ